MFASMTRGIFALFVLVLLVALLLASTASSETCTSGSCHAAAGISATETAAFFDTDLASVEDADAVRFIQIPAVALSSSNVAVEKVARHDEEEEYEVSKTKILANRSSLEVQQSDAKAQNRSSQSAAPDSQALSELVFNQIEFELHRTDLSGKSKLVLVLLEGFGIPALLGIDRCYMGQCCVGVVKGITVGGLGIWALIDYIVVLINALQKKDSISMFGFTASFSESTITPAFWASIIFLILKCLTTCTLQAHQARGQEPNKDDTTIQQGG